MRGIGPHRALVLAGHDPSCPCFHIADSVSVFVVPTTGSQTPAPRTDDGALLAIRARLDEARMLTMRVFVARPAFRPVALAVDIAAATGSPADFTGELRPALTRYFHPATGGPDGTGWPFGRALRPSELLRVAQAELGPGARVERVGVRLLDGAAPEEDCTELATGPSELVLLEHLVVRVRRATYAEASL
jgi:hypothetical protein